MLKVYLVQFDSAKGNKTENLARAKKMILDAKPDAGSLVLLPEMFATGYVPADLDNAAEDFSSSESGETSRTLSEVSTATGCTIMGAGITRASDGFYNHVSIYKPRETKEFCGYNKMNLFFPEKENFKAGGNINLFKLKEIPDQVGNDNKAESVDGSIVYLLRFALPGNLPRSDQKRRKFHHDPGGVACQETHPLGNAPQSPRHRKPGLYRRRKRRQRK